MKLLICRSDHGCPLLQFDHAARKFGYMRNHPFPNVAIKRTRAPSEEFRFSRSGADTGSLRIRVRSRFASAGSDLPSMGTFTKGYRHHRIIESGDPPELVFATRCGPKIRPATIAGRLDSRSVKALRTIEIHADGGPVGPFERLNVGLPRQAVVVSHCDETPGLLRCNNEPANVTKSSSGRIA